MPEKDRVADVLTRLLETTQDLFIFQALESGLSVQSVKGLVRVETDRVTRVSKIRRTRARKESRGD
jgi:hypothetical protein